MEVGIGFGLMLLFWLPFAAVCLGAVFFWIWMLIDCLTKEPSEGNDKLIWTIVIIFTTWIGALIYYFVRRPERIRQYGH